MEILIVAGIIVVAVLLLAWPAWLKAETRAKRLTNPAYSPPHMMGMFDELFHPSAHHATQVQQEQRVLPAPAPTPGDKDLDRGRVTIDLGGKPQ